MLDFRGDFLTERLIFMIPLILSLSVHEWAHAWTAWMFGDDTAKLLGRMTLNPLAHIDPVGTILLPLLGIPFGWAKPVPINPLRFSRNVSMATGVLWTAAAGPISNLVLAAVSCAILFALSHLTPGVVAQNRELRMFFDILILMNVLLALFNCLPIPPLDGSRIADSLMPRRWRSAWDQFCSLGSLALVMVIVLPMLAGVSLFRWPVEKTMQLIDWVTR